MAHEVLQVPGYNAYVRAIRSFLMDAPRVVRGNDHTDINNLGITYQLSGGGARPSGDLLTVIATPGVNAPPRTTHRATCVVAGNNCVYGTQNTGINVQFTSSLTDTIQNTDSVDFSTNFTVGDLVRVDGATTAGNDGVFRIASITTTTTTNDTLTLDSSDSLAATETGSVTLIPIGGGAIFSVTEDAGGADNFIGWLASNIEFVANDGSVYLNMINGGSWAINDYAEWTFERGPFSLSDEASVTRTVTFNDNGASADTITRNDYEGSFIRDGFVNGGLIGVSGSASNDNNGYTITAITDTTITLSTGVLVAEADVEVTLTPKIGITADFSAAARTITRSSGSFVTDGFLDGGLIEIEDAASATNNGLFEIQTVTATVITLVSTETLVDATGDAIKIIPRNTILQKWSDHRYVWSLTSGATGPSSQDLSDGGLIPVPDSNGNYTSEWVGIGPGLDTVNNPQTVYVGLQTQFSGVLRHNVEVRGFDSVSSVDFSVLGNASPPTYVYLDDAAFSVFMAGDGDMVAALAIGVGGTRSEWMYGGYTNVHGSQNQHPRPLMVGGMGWNSSLDQSSTSTDIQFFPRPKGNSATTTPFVENSTCWFRWLDGQWFPVYNSVVLSSGIISEDNSAIFVWPYSTDAVIETKLAELGGASTTFAFSSSNGISSISQFARNIVPTPTTVTPTREFPLLPLIMVMENPDQNIVADMKRVFFTTHSANTVGNLITHSGIKYVAGGNHERVTAENFAALQLN